MFKVEFDTSNDAFEVGGVSEIAACLTIIAGKVEDGETEGAIKDSNGNTVGSWTWET